MPPREQAERRVSSYHPRFSEYAVYEDETVKVISESELAEFMHLDGLVVIRAYGLGPLTNPNSGYVQLLVTRLPEILKYVPPEATEILLICSIEGILNDLYVGSYDKIDDFFQHCDNDWDFTLAYVFEPGPSY